MTLISKTTIFLSGKEVPTFKKVQLHQKIHSHHILEIRFPWEVFEDSEGELGNKSQNFLGETLSIEIATIDDDINQKEQLVFKGIVTGVKIVKGTLGETGDEIVLMASSHEIISNDGQHYNCFHEQRLGDIVKKTLKDYGLKLSVDSTFKDGIDYIVQHNESSYEFIKRLAEQYGQWFYYNGEKVIFGKPEDKVTELTYHYDLREFNLSLIPQPQSFNYFTNDYLSNKVQSEEGNHKPAGVSGKNATVYNKSDEIYSKKTNVWINSNNDANSNKVIRAKAKAQQESFAVNQVRINGRSDNSGVAIGNILKIEGESYRVVAVVHSVDRTEDYENHFEAINANINGYPFTNINSFPKSQSQIAIVTETNDPDGLGRIKVSFPWQDFIGETTPWIRVVTPHAGDQKGIQFLPEIGDQVLVDFEGGDAECPYVIGALYHKDQKPNGDWASKDNDIKAIKTRSGHTFVFDDTEGQESITIEDKKGNKIFMDTASGDVSINAPNSITLNSANITIAASNNLEITAANKADLKAMKVTAEADTNFTVKGGAKIDLKAPMIGIKGDASAKLEGAIVDINGTGMTNVKGGVVNLN
jgi:type VI secretion system secreted protein VgrG